MAYAQRVPVILRDPADLGAQLGYWQNQNNNVLDSEQAFREREAQKANNYFENQARMEQRGNELNYGRAIDERNRMDILGENAANRTRREFEWNTGRTDRANELKLELGLRNRELDLKTGKTAEDERAVENAGQSFQQGAHEIGSARDQAFDEWQRSFAALNTAASALVSEYGNQIKWNPKKDVMAFVASVDPTIRGSKEIAAAQEAAKNAAAEANSRLASLRTDHDLVSEKYGQLEDGLNNLRTEAGKQWGLSIEKKNGKWMVVNRGTQKEWSWNPPAAAPMTEPARVPAENNFGPMWLQGQPTGAEAPPPFPFGAAPETNTGTNPMPETPAGRPLDAATARQLRAQAGSAEGARQLARQLGYTF